MRRWSAQGATLVARRDSRRGAAGADTPLRRGIWSLFSCGRVICAGWSRSEVATAGSAYRTDNYRLLARRRRSGRGGAGGAAAGELRKRGALVLRRHEPDRRVQGDLRKALWDPGWAGEVTNDTLAPLRFGLRGAPRRSGGHRIGAGRLRSRASAPRGSEGRWRASAAGGTHTEQRSSSWRRLLLRPPRRGHARGGVHAEELAADPRCTPVRKAMEDAGRRGADTSSRGSGARRPPCPAEESRELPTRAQAEEAHGGAWRPNDQANPTARRWRARVDGRGTRSSAPPAPRGLTRRRVVGWGWAAASRICRTLLPDEVSPPTPHPTPPPPGRTAGARDGALLAASGEVRSSVTESRGGRPGRERVAARAGAQGGGLRASSRANKRAPLARVAQKRSEAGKAGRGRC